MGMAGQHDLVFLIMAHKRCGHIDVPICLLVLCNRCLTTNGVACEHRSKKLEDHFASDIVHIATELRRQGRRQETLNHQAPLLIRLDMVDTLVTGKLTKKPDVFLRKGTFPRSSITDLHCITSRHGAIAAAPISTNLSVERAFPHPYHIQRELADSCMVGETLAVALGWCGATARVARLQRIAL